MDPTAGLATVTGIVQTLQALAGLSKNVNAVEFNQKLIELQRLIFELQGKLLEIQNENTMLTEENRRLKSVEEIRGKLIFSRQVYWVMDGDNLDGPYCPNCWDLNRKLVRLTIWDGSDPKAINYRCGIDGNYFYAKER